MKKNILLSLMLSLGLILFAFAGNEKKGKSGPLPDSTIKPKSETKSIEETVKKCRKMPGLFTIFQDTTNGSAFLLVKKEQVGKEFIYFCFTADGTVATGHFRGSFRDNIVFSIRKYFNKIEFIAENNNFYFDPASPLSKAAEANVLKGILCSQQIAASNKDQTEYLIKADDLFLTEAMHQVKPSPFPGLQPGMAFTMGMLSKEKSKYLSIKNYPQNTDVVTEYVYDNPAPINLGGKDIADPRYLTVKLQHSLIEMPKGNYKPRFDDPRIGFFITQKDNMTSTSVTPYHDFIHRWNLEKKDKNLAISEPVEPITFWIENTTPTELRPIIKKAGLAWNEAFEAAGFKNAIAIKEQSDTASWDAGDIRYNVLRWTSSPFPPFGGYGPSFINPRTGQILGADIMLEYAFLSNRMRVEGIFSTGKDASEYPGAMEAFSKSHDYCMLNNHLQHTQQFGSTILQAREASALELSRLREEAVYYLILHEMGHTLGLNHNMKASQLHPPDKIHDRNLTEKVGLTGSVMDYPAINFALDKSRQGQFYTTKPGPYDKWAIEFGYSEPLSDAEAEKNRLNRIASRSTEPQLAFGNDADDMRAPGKAIDPRVNVNDLSQDAISYSIERIKLVNTTLKGLKAKFTKPDQSYEELRVSMNVAMNELFGCGTILSRYIGGIFVDRSLPGQNSPNKPFTPVPLADQKKAMNAISNMIFGANAIQAPNDLYNYLQLQRRGYNLGRENEDPHLTDRVLNAQKQVLDHLMHPNTLKRITDSELYGNAYKLPDMMNDLTSGIFKEDLASKVNVYRQNIQTEYVTRLIKAAFPSQSLSAFGSGSQLTYQAQANALAQLKKIKAMLLVATTTDETTKVHRDNLIFRINKSMEAKG